MRLLFVVQRYGPEVAGGAELHCREFASRLAKRGHDVEALTSRAISYATWANEYPEGDDLVDGVTVHRLSVGKPREDRFFGPLNARVAWGRKPIPSHLQYQWMKSQGPDLPDLEEWLTDEGGSYDLIIFFTYLYYTTWAGLPAASSVAPTVLHPTAHDEPPLYLELFDLMFRIPSAFAFSSPEEENLVMDRFHVRQPSDVFGIGVSLEVEDDPGLFRSAFDVSDPYLLYVGRLDPAKGANELMRFFAEYKKRNPGSLRLVMVGERVQESLKEEADILFTGFLSDELKASAMSGALALVQPSYFESFSMVLTEAWAHRKPALVQGHCAVLDGQVRRSRGGVLYGNFAEFETSLQMLIEQPSLRRSLGAAGRRFVEQNFGWDTVLAKYETFWNESLRAQ